MDFIKQNWKHALVMVLTMLATLGVIRFQLDPNASNVLIVLPANFGELPNAEPAKMMGATPVEGPLKNQPVLTALARIAAAEQYAKDSGLTPMQAWILARSVKQADIETMAQAKGLTFEGVPTKGPILDWIKTHPEQFQMLVQIIVAILASLADAGQAFTPQDWVASIFAWAA